MKIYRMYREIQNLDQILKLLQNFSLSESSRVTPECLGRNKKICIFLVIKMILIRSHELSDKKISNPSKPE